MSGRSWRFARVLGIDIFIDSSWVLIFLLVTWTLAAGYFPRAYANWPVGQYWLVGVVTSVLFFTSVLVHEISHSLVARRQGERVDRITLFLFGGASQMSEEPKTAATEFLMALAGPVASFVQAGLYAVLRTLTQPASEALGAMFYYLAVINVGLGVFNLIPGFPLDGGRVLRSILWAATRNMRLATRVASWAGQTVAFLMVILGVFRLFTGDWLNGLWIMSIGWFLRNAAVSSYRQIVVRDAMRDVLASQLMHADFVPVGPEMTISELVDSYMIKRHEHAYPVLENNRLAGIICLHDVRKVPRAQWAGTMVRQAMTPGPQLQVVTPGDDGNTVLSRMAAKDVHQVPVMDGERLVGMVTRSDLVRFLQWQTEMGMG